MTPRRVVIVIYPGFQILDLTGPHEVFRQAGYRLETVAYREGPIESGGGLAVLPTSTTADCVGAIDTLVVVGGHRDPDDELVAWVARAAGRSRRVAAVCTGAFLLARAGLLTGRRVVTHWLACDELAVQNPDITVVPDPIFVKDGPIWTSAGVTAGMDLALAMVDEDHGAAVARRIARQLVMFVQRPGGQAQFSAQLAAQRPAPEPIRGVQSWLAEHLAEGVTVPAMAERAGMSQRHFTRVFAAHIGQTPAAYLEAVRIEAARGLLETTATTLAEIARRCGFGTVETMHRAFRRGLGVTPGQYRHHFSPA